MLIFAVRNLRIAACRPLTPLACSLETWHEQFVIVFTLHTSCLFDMNHGVVSVKLVSHNEQLWISYLLWHHKLCILRIMTGNSGRDGPIGEGVQAILTTTPLWGIIILPKSFVKKKLTSKFVTRDMLAFRNHVPLIQNSGPPPYDKSWSRPCWATLWTLSGAVH